MLNEARLTENMRNGLWTEAALKVTMIENISVSKYRKQPAYKLLYGKEKGQV